MANTFILLHCFISITVALPLEVSHTQILTLFILSNPELFGSYQSAWSELLYSDETVTFIVKGAFGAPTLTMFGWNALLSVSGGISKHRNSPYYYKAATNWMERDKLDGWTAVYFGVLWACYSCFISATWLPQEPNEAVLQPRVLISGPWEHLFHIKCLLVDVFCLSNKMKFGSSLYRRGPAMSSLLPSLLLPCSK